MKIKKILSSALVVATLLPTLAGCQLLPAKESKKAIESSQVVKESVEKEDAEAVEKEPLKKMKSFKDAQYVAESLGQIVYQGNYTTLQPMFNTDEYTYRDNAAYELAEKAALQLSNGYTIESYEELYTISDVLNLYSHAMLDMYTKIGSNWSVEVEETEEGMIAHFTVETPVALNQVVRDVGNNLQTEYGLNPDFYDKIYGFNTSSAATLEEKAVYQACIYLGIALEYPNGSNTPLADEVSEGDVFIKKNSDGTYSPTSENIQEMMKIGGAQAYSK